MKRIIALILVVSFVFALSACDGKGEKEEGNTTQEYVLPTKIVDSDISLPYTSAAGFNPYKTKSALNRDLIPVVFESLFKSTDDGKGKVNLATTFVNEGNTVSVKLEQGVKFSDGSELISRDIKNSFDLARQNIYYKGNLSNIADIILVDNYTVNFKLYNSDVFSVNSLNFPVVKYSDGEYIGTGKYYFDYLEDTPFLQVNKYHREYKKNWNKQIALYDMAGITSPVYPFKANKISVYKNDLSESEYINLSSKTASVGMNNLVYIGVNSKWAGTVTSIDWVRQAVNIGIDRNMITAGSFLGQGTPTVTPFKNQCAEISDMELVGTRGNVERAIGILERHGYTQVDSDGVRSNGNSSLRVSILVCTQNPYKLTVAENFKKSLERLGFGVTITEKKTAKAFAQALKDEYFSFYVGEVALSDNYNLSGFFTESGNLNYGISDENHEIYSSYKKGEINIRTFVESFSTNVPFIPLFYRNAVVSVNPNVQGVAEQGDIYESVCYWKIKKAL